MLLIYLSLASIDSIFVGISYKIAHYKLKWWDFLLLFIFSFCILILMHLLFYITNFKDSLTNLKSVIFLILGILSLKNKDDEKVKNSFTLKEKILFSIGNSIDGFLISLTLLNLYAPIFLSFLFALFGVLFFIFGYYFTPRKKSLTKFSSIIYFILAFIALF